MARSYFCDHCDNAMAKGGRVTLNIAVNEPHKAPFPLSFTKELCPLCYESLMAAIAEVMSKPNQVSAAHLVQADAGALIDGPVRAQQELTKCPRADHGIWSGRKLVTMLAGRRRRAVAVSRP